MQCYLVTVFITLHLVGTFLLGARMSHFSLSFKPPKRGGNYTAWPKKSQHLNLTKQISKSLLLDNECMVASLSAGQYDNFRMCNAEGSEGIGTEQLCSLKRNPLISDVNQKKKLKVAREHKDWTTEQ